MALAKAVVLFVKDPIQTTETSNQKEKGDEQSKHETIQLFWKIDFREIFFSKRRASSKHILGKGGLEEALGLGRKDPKRIFRK